MAHWVHLALTAIGIAFLAAQLSGGPVASVQNAACDRQSPGGVLYLMTCSPPGSSGPVLAAPAPEALEIAATAAAP
jgi:hypothetical protein